MQVPDVFGRCQNRYKYFLYAPQKNGEQIVYRAPLTMRVSNAFQIFSAFFVSKNTSGYKIKKLLSKIVGDEPNAFVTLAVTVHGVLDVGWASVNILEHHQC